MSQESLTVRLKTLHCFQNDEEKFDDIYLKYKGKKIWPKDKKHEDMPIGSKPIDLDIPNIKPMEEMIIEVWDYDTFSRNDLLGKTRMIADQPGGPYTVDMIPVNEKETARYSIDWQVLWPDQM